MQPSVKEAPRGFFDSQKSLTRIPSEALLHFPYFFPVEFAVSASNCSWVRSQW